MSEFFAIFEPGLRHLIEERERRRLDIQRPGEGAPPFGPVDLDAGVAYIEQASEPQGHDGHAADGDAPPPAVAR
ncbi:DUF6191 domain-containing protein [Georgenia thermotolerans]|uniref:DUF6191 domain-containing protein n=1 Tax=Georgenia thermotolerans TaxID=527326 RepID=UPI00186B1265|nr:DUF6191 domain-containing protein [Georgenia thermotolerans]